MIKTFKTEDLHDISFGDSQWNGESSNSFPDASPSSVPTTPPRGNSRSPKKRGGGVTRNNEMIGNLSVPEANQLIAEICGYHSVDLHLPYFDEQNKARDGVVIIKKLCMVCMENHTDTGFRTHVQKQHTDLDGDILEVMVRMSDCRYVRFCNDCIITDELLDDFFAEFPKKSLINFFASLGFIIQSKEVVVKNAEQVQRKKSTKGIKKEVKHDWSLKYKEKSIRGVNPAKAYELLNKMTDMMIYQPEVEFAETLITHERKLSASSYSVKFCHICSKHLHLNEFDIHVRSHGKVWPEIQPYISVECDIHDVLQAFKRLAEVRKALYYSSIPIRLSKIQKICDYDDAAMRKMIDFLVKNGFAVDKRDHKEELPVPEATFIIPFGEAECQKEIDEIVRSFAGVKYECKSECGSEYGSANSGSMGSIRSRSGSVSSSGGSSASSRISLRDPSEPSRDAFPYCVLNAIPQHIQIEHALSDLLDAMTEDLEFKLNQFEYMFLLGFATFSLVVGNGSKLNVISRLKMGDWRNKKVDTKSGLTYFSYTTEKQCLQTEIQEFVCADEHILRSMEIFEAARERRAKELNLTEKMKSDESPFFATFTNMSGMKKDANYPMRQFLQMSGIDWSCQGSAICSAAWSLLARDNSKVISAQYVLTYFQSLREKEAKQIGFLVTPNVYEHPTFSNIKSVRISIKKRQTLAPHERKRKKQKRYDSPERRNRLPIKRGGDRRSLGFLRTIGKITEGGPTTISSSSNVIHSNYSYEGSMGMQSQQPSNVPVGMYNGTGYRQEAYYNYDPNVHQHHHPLPPLPHPPPQPQIQLPQAPPPMSYSDFQAQQAQFPHHHMVQVKQYETTNVDDKVMTCL